MLANRGQEIFVEASLRQEKVCAQRFSAAGCFANSGRALDCESSANRGFARSREGTASEQVLESLVAHIQVDLGAANGTYTAIGMSIVHGRFTWRRRCVGQQQHLISLFGHTHRPSSCPFQPSQKPVAGSFGIEL